MSVLWCHILQVVLWSTSVMHVCVDVNDAIEIVKRRCNFRSTVHVLYSTCHQWLLT